MVFLDCSLLDELMQLKLFVQVVVVLGKSRTWPVIGICVFLHLLIASPQETQVR